MTSERKIAANRANARASTGPQTTRGRARAARNALRHALSLPVASIPALSEEVEALAREIAGPGADAAIQELARRVAEAQSDLRRVRHARHQFLSDTLSQEYYSYTKMRMKLKILRALLRPNPPDISTEVLKFATSNPSLEGPDKLATILLGRGKSYWRWIAMNGERCHGANLPSEPLMRRADAIAIIECGGTQTLAGPSLSARTIRATISGNLTVDRQSRICAAFEGSPSEHMISLDRTSEES